jgi:DNA polymerase
LTRVRVTPAFVAAHLREIGIDYVPAPCRAAGGAGAGAGEAPGGAGDAAEPAGAPRPGSAPDPAFEALRAEALACRRCSLRGGAKQVVFGTGDPRARLMFIGEGPGADEDDRGEPFVGAAGKRLNGWIPRLGLTREQVYIANIVKCRPPGNRAPVPEEAEVCLPWLVRQIELVRPEMLCLLGATALRFLLGGEPRITKERGRWREYRGIPVLPTYHPAYILRDPRREDEVFSDMETLKARLDAR